MPAFICQHVFDAERPVLLVVHDADGDWQLLCGDRHGEDVRPRVVGLDHLLRRDPGLAEVMDLKVGWEAERSDSKSAWRPSRAAG